MSKIKTRAVAVAWECLINWPWNPESLGWQTPAQTPAGQQALQWRWPGCTRSTRQPGQPATSEAFPRFERFAWKHETGIQEGPLVHQVSGTQSIMRNVYTAGDRQFNSSSPWTQNRWRGRRSLVFGSVWGRRTFAWTLWRRVERR